MELFVTKNGNSWELLLAVVSKNFVLNVTGLLDMALKCIDKFKIKAKVSHPACTYSMLTLNVFCTLSYCYYC